MASRSKRIQRPAARLICFVSGLALFLLALEIVERRNASLMAGASHRALTKLAIFEKRPRVELLFIGSSRMLDGVSPDLVSRGLRQAAPELGGLSGYNASFTGSSLGSLMSLAPRFSCRKELRAVVVELSEPQLINEPASWEEPVQADITIEGRLQEWSRGLCIIRYRKALLPDNLGRLPALLLFSASLDGWEVRGSDQLASWLGRKEPPAAGFEEGRWAPETFTPAAPAQQVAPDAEAVLEQVSSLVRQFAESGIRVVFAVPPMRSSEKDAPERNRMRGTFAEVARRSGCEVWNFAALDLPDAFFRDLTHLNKEGRAQYSQALAMQLARLLGGK